MAVKKKDDQFVLPPHTRIGSSDPTGGRSHPNPESSRLPELDVSSEGVASPPTLLPKPEELAEDSLGRVRRPPGWAKNF